jgi:hypothetical protein
VSDFVITDNSIRIADDRQLPTLAAQADLGAKLLQRTMCLDVTIRRFGITRKASMGTVQVNADKELLNLSKRLVESKTYTAVVSTANALRQYMKRVSVPDPFVKSGFYRVPTEMVETVAARLEEFQTEFNQHVQEFCDEYEGKGFDDNGKPRVSIADQMAGPLGSLYNALDYPTVDKVRASFGIEWRYVENDVPGRLQSISKRLFEAELQKERAKAVSSMEEIRNAIRLEMSKFVSTMAERLKPGADGKKRILRTSTVENLEQFLATFSLRDVTDDADLSALVEKARDVMRGVDAEQIRSDDDLRERISTTFDALTEQIQPMVVNRGTRQISLED